MLRCPLALVLSLLAALGAGAALAAPATAARPSGTHTITGTLQSFHGQTARGRGDVEGWLLVTRGGRRIPVTMASGLRPRAGQAVRARAVRRSAGLRIVALRRLPGATARRSATPTGAKRTAVVLFNFNEDRSTPFTHEQVRDSLFTGSKSVSAYFSEQTQGRLTLTGRDRADGDVYGWHAIDATNTVCFGGADYNWYSRADAAVAAAGGSLNGYDHVVYVHPETRACAFAGIASLGADFSSLNGRIALWVAGHEIGHNFGFEHAGKAYCRDGDGAMTAISRSCEIEPYDDPYDIMGNRYQRHTSAVRALQAGWIPSSDLRTVSADGTYQLAPLNQPGSAPRVLRIPRSDGRNYWLEFRRPHGAFDDFSLTEPVVSGVLVRVAGGISDPGQTELVDANPQSAWYVRDEALAAGRSVTDPLDGIRITTEQAGPDGARVSVAFGVTASNVAAPAPSPAPGPAAEPDAPASPSGEGAGGAGRSRHAAVRAHAAGRRLAVARLHAADGRALRVVSARRRLSLQTRFAPGTAAGSQGQLELRLRASRRCVADVSLRTGAGGWQRLAGLRTARNWSSHFISLPAGALPPVSDVRVGCRESRRVLDVDVAALELG